MELGHLRNNLETLAQRYRIPGAQLVIGDGRTTAAIETGEREYGSSLWVSASDQFPLGSVTKAFTATLAMQLVADGDLDLDVPVTEYAPELRGSRDDHFATVTLRQLLSHTAGLVSNPELADRDPASLSRYALDCAQLAPLHPPGQRFSYSNPGYVLVGHLIEIASGQSWWDAVEEFLLGPLGIEPLFLANPQAGRRPGPAVTGHAVRNAQGQVQPVDTYLPTSWAPAGGLAVSCSDLVKLAELHCGAPAGRGLLGVPEFAEMHKPVDGADAFGLADGWCLGWGCFHTGSTGWLGHDGTTEGTTCNLRFDPATGTTVALMTNATSGLLLWRDIVGVLAAEGLHVGVQPTPSPGPAAAVPPADCVDEYRNGEMLWTVNAPGAGALILQDETGTREHLSMLDSSAFISQRIDVDDAPALGRFLRDQTGRISDLQLSGRVFRRKRTEAESKSRGRVRINRGERQ